MSIGPRNFLYSQIISNQHFLFRHLGLHDVWNLERRTWRHDWRNCNVDILHKLISYYVNHVRAEIIKSMSFVFQIPSLLCGKLTHETSTSFSLKHQFSFTLGCVSNPTIREIADRIPDTNRAVTSHIDNFFARRTYAHLFMKVDWQWSGTKNK